MGSLIMPYKYEFWTKTSGDLHECRTKILTPLKKQSFDGKYKIVVDPAIRKQKWIGAGAAITDATASLLWHLEKEQRYKILHGIFSPQEASFSLVRISIGACDFGSEIFTHRYYSYDDISKGETDFSLKYFSIGNGQPGDEHATKDLKYIIPVLQEILKINPAVKILATSWSAPAWMKGNQKMTNGGMFSHKLDLIKLKRTYANYFIKFVEAYRNFGIPIYALSIQNEPSNPAPWPAMIWKIEDLVDFGTNYLRPLLDKKFPEIKLFLWDGSLDILNKPSIKNEEFSAFDGFAFHSYAGPYTNVIKAKRLNPNWELAMSERRCMLNETVPDQSHIMFGLIGNYFIREGISSIFLWNLALDERGLPNTAGSTGRRGVITLDHTTGKIRRNLEYYMLRNFSQDIRTGSVLIGSSNYTSNGYSGGPGSVAFQGPGASISGQIYNPSKEEINVGIRIASDNYWQVVNVPAYGTVTFNKSNYSINESEPAKNNNFELHPCPTQLMGDVAPDKEK